MALDCIFQGNSLVDKEINLMLRRSLKKEDQLSLAQAWLVRLALYGGRYAEAEETLGKITAAQRSEDPGNAVRQLKIQCVMTGEILK